MCSTTYSTLLCKYKKRQHLCCFLVSFHACYRYRIFGQLDIVCNEKNLRFCCGLIDLIVRIQSEKLLFNAIVLFLKSMEIHIRLLAQCCMIMEVNIFLIQTLGCMMWCLLLLRNCFYARQITTLIGQIP